MLFFYTQSRSEIELRSRSIFQHFSLHLGNHFTCVCVGADLIENFTSRLIFMKENSEGAREDPLKLGGTLRHFNLKR